MKEKYLSIGSVVRLNNGKKNLMIVGFSASAPEAEGKIFDYIGCLHPEGVMSSDMNFLFNHDQIVEVLFEGFVNDEEKTFKRRLNEFLSNGTIDGVVPNLAGVSNSGNNNLVQQTPVQNQNIIQPQMFNNNNVN